MRQWMNAKQTTSDENPLTLIWESNFSVTKAHMYSMTLALSKNLIRFTFSVSYYFW